MVTYNTANMENLAAQHFLPELKWPKAFQIYVLRDFNINTPFLLPKCIVYEVFFPSC